MSEERITTEMPPLVIRKEIEIDAPIDRVWPFVGTAEGYARWSCPPAEAHDVVLEPRVGGRYEDLMVVGGREYYGVGEVIVYDPPLRLSVRVRSRAGDLVDAQHGSTITIVLTDLGDRTRVTVEHSGFESLPADRRAGTFESFDQGWAHAVAELGVAVTVEAPPAGAAAVAVRRQLIWKEIDIAAPIARVWWFIGTQAGSLQRHRAEIVPGTVEYQDELLEERVGGQYALRGLFGGQPFEITGRVVAYDPPRLLVLTWREEGWPADTRVTFRLRERDGRTSITVLHTGFERLPVEIREREMPGYETGRQRGLEVLRTLLESEDAESAGMMTIRRDITIDAPAHRVWPFVATREGLLRWWTSTRSLVLEARAGGRFEIVVEFDGRSYTIVGRVLTYDPLRLFRIAWRELDGDAGAWPAETVVTFTLAETGAGTRVTVEHSGFERLPAAIRAEMVRSYEHGWTAEEMERLRQLVQEEISGPTG